MSVNPLKWKSRNLLYFVMCLTVIYVLFLHKRTHRVAFEGTVKNTKPEAIWEFVADFSNMKMLNPTMRVSLLFSNSLIWIRQVIAKKKLLQRGLQHCGRERQFWSLEILGSLHRTFESHSGRSEHRARPLLCQAGRRGISHKFRAQNVLLLQLWLPWVLQTNREIILLDFRLKQLNRYFQSTRLRSSDSTAWAETQSASRACSTSVRRYSQGCATRKSCTSGGRSWRGWRNTSRSPTQWRRTINKSFLPTRRCL